MYTWQDFESDRQGGISPAIHTLINRHKASDVYRVAIDADAYDHQRNTTITRFINRLYTFDGRERPDITSSNNRLCSNFFAHLNGQRVQYSLGNGLSFESDIKDKLGETFDTRIAEAGRYALIHGVTFLFWNVDHLHVFPVTEFAPLYDEETGELKAGLRYWQIDEKKPVSAVLYEVDGYTRFRADKMSSEFKPIEEKRAYRMVLRQAPQDAEPEVIAEENYSALPILPLYGSRLKQSTLVGMKAKIDAYDLVSSGFANDLADCAQIYWMIGGAGGMSDADFAKFRDRMKLTHIAAVDDIDNVTITPHTNEIPVNARSVFLKTIRDSIYEDFGALDVHAVAAGSTNDHIEAAYQPLDDAADDYEYQIIDMVQRLLLLIGEDPETPTFKRNRISNEMERTNMVLSAASYLDQETVLVHLPFISSDEVPVILDRLGVEDMERYSGKPAVYDTDQEEQEQNTNE